MVSYALCKHSSVYVMKGSFCHRLWLVPISSYFLLNFFVFFASPPHFTLSYCHLLPPQLRFLPNFYCFCLLSLFPLPLLLPLHFLLRHPPSPEFICSAEFHCVRIQPWHKAGCDLVTSNLSLNHNETLSQTKFHHMRGISCREIIFLDEKGIPPVAALPPPQFFAEPKIVFTSV